MYKIFWLNDSPEGESPRRDTLLEQKLHVIKCSGLFRFYYTCICKNTFLIEIPLRDNCFVISSLSPVEARAYIYPCLKIRVKVILMA